MIRVGDRIDRYEVLEPKGSGGMAEVWRVRHVSLGSEHVLKVPLQADEATCDRVRREGEVMARLRHAHVVRVTDLVEVSTPGREGTVPGLVMDEVSGETLEEWLVRRKPTWAERAEVYRQVASALACVHGAGVVHRDLSTRNVMVSETPGGWSAHVLDFGLARQVVRDVRGRTVPGVTMGTFEVMAPEQIRDAAGADARADVWSLGVLLYLLLEDRLPFRADDLLGLLQVVSKGAFSPPRGAAWAVELVGRCLVVDREERLGSGAEVLRAVERGLGGAKASEPTAPARRRVGTVEVDMPARLQVEESAIQAGWFGWVTKPWGGPVSRARGTRQELAEPREAQPPSTHALILAPASATPLEPDEGEVTDPGARLTEGANPGDPTSTEALVADQPTEETTPVAQVVDGRVRSQPAPTVRVQGRAWGWVLVTAVAAVGGTGLTVAVGSFVVAWQARVPIVEVPPAKMEVSSTEPLELMGLDATLPLPNVVMTGIDGAPFDPQPTVQWRVDPPTMARVEGNVLVPAAEGEGRLVAVAAGGQHEWPLRVSTTWASPSTRMQMVWIPGGSFVMGSPETEAGRFRDEGQHEVVLTRGYWLGSVEVTQELWQLMYPDRVFDDCQNDFCNGAFCDPYMPAQVSWFEAVEFANKLSRADGLTPSYHIDGKTVVWDRWANGYRLPTEAEWERAARAGTSDMYAGVSRIEELCSIANIDDASSGCVDAGGGRVPCTDGAPGLARVASYRPNRFGLYDMTGNAWEWVWDWYGPYSSSTATDPAGPASGGCPDGFSKACRVVRGGDYRSAEGSRVARRASWPPWIGNGFRLARSP